MVYNIYNGSIGKPPPITIKKVSNIRTQQTLNFHTQSMTDIEAKDAQRQRSERVDINTWIKNDHHKYNASKSWLLGGRKSIKKSNKYMGSTVSDIFSNSVKEYTTKPCLGYRAVVTCPVITQNEEGKQVLQDKSFRSDYTWYTYEQVGRRVQDIASGLYANSLNPNSRAFFYASTSLEWFLASQACYQLAGELVLAPEINDSNSILLILKESEVSIIFISCDRLLQLSVLFKQMELRERSLINQIKKIVLIDWLFSIDYYSEPVFVELRRSSQEMMDKMVSLGQIEEAGVERPINLSCTKCFEGINTNEEEFINITTQENSSKRKKSRIHIARKISAKLYANLLSPTLEPLQGASSEPLKRKAIKGLKPSASNSREVLDKASSTHQLDRLQPNRKIGNSKSYTSIISLSKPSKSLHENAVKPDDLAMIVYSHGRLGDLKAVMLSHSYLTRSNHYSFLDGLISGSDKFCTTLSLDNIIEFMTELCIFSHGGSVGYSSNNKTLFYDGKDLFKRDQSDLQALRPSILLVRPYILESFRASIQNYISLQYNPLKSFLLTNLIYEYKKYWARRHFKTPIVDRIFCSELQNLFGGKLKSIFCNGATDCTETKDFFSFMVNIPIIELYGSDEAIVSLMSVNDIWDYKRRKLKQQNQKANWCSPSSNVDDDNSDQEDFPDIPKLMPPKVDKNTAFRADSSKNLLITSSILCPTLGTRIRLEDWEDFRTSDLPYPRGRVIIGGSDVVICRGYFNRETSTKLAFYQDSNYITWFRTDDIARVFPNGSFEIISNLSDIIKLTDGQFISLSQIEHIIRNSQFVDNVCAICGDDRKFIIALVVPNLRRLALKSMGQDNLKMVIGMEPEPEELVDIEFRREVCNDRLLCEFVTGHLNELIVKAGFEAIPNRFHLVPEIWTPETELVTPAFEPKRSAIQNFYAADIQSIVKLEFRRMGSSRLSARRLTNSKRLLGNTYTIVGGRLSC